MIAIFKWISNEDTLLAFKIITIIIGGITAITFFYWDYMKKRNPKKRTVLWVFGFLILLALLEVISSIIEKNILAEDANELKKERKKYTDLILDFQDSTFLRLDSINDDVLKNLGKLDIVSDSLNSTSELTTSISSELRNSLDLQENLLDKQLESGEIQLELYEQSIKNYYRLDNIRFNISCDVDSMPTLSRHIQELCEKDLQKKINAGLFQYCRHEGKFQIDSLGIKYFVTKDSLINGYHVRDDLIFNTQESFLRKYPAKIKMSFPKYKELYFYAIDEFSDFYFDLSANISFVSGDFKTKKLTMSFSGTGKVVITKDLNEISIFDLENKHIIFGFTDKRYKPVVSSVRKLELKFGQNYSRVLKFREIPGERNREGRYPEPFTTFYLQVDNESLKLDEINEVD